MVGWMLAHGIHRRVLRTLMVGVAIGVAGGHALHHPWIAAHGILGVIGVLGLGMLALWPIAWMATWRIARPLQDLAKIAAEMRAGHLDSRRRLPVEGPGEVGEVAGTLHGLADRVARQLADQRALLAAVSHELRSPLGRARVLVEMLREGSAPATAHDDLQAEIDAMDGLVADLLASARIDFEAVSPKPQRAVDLIGRAVEAARCEGVPVDADPELGVQADPTLAARALSVLLDNASRYGGRPVAVRAVVDGGWARFEVDDDGPGFAPGDEERAFQPFWRGGGPDHRPEGHGLGLALVRQIAQAHGGKAGVGARPGGGARVWFTLPVAREPLR